MQNRLIVRCTCALALTVFGALAASAQKPFHVEDRWLIGGEGGWDYLTADPTTHRLYIAHTTKVDVVDTNTGKVIGAVTGLTRCHGVVIAPDGKTGFVSDGGANQVIAFDPKTFVTLAKIPAGTNPDGIAYEPVTNTVWAFNGRSKDATIIDASQKKAIGTIALPGKPEFPQTDGKGTIFVNIEDKNVIVRLDAKTRMATATWPLAGCDSPSGMAIDTAGSRLFSVCDGNKMAVTDAKTGRSLATPSIGEGPDAAGYDARSKLAFSSNGDGTLTIIDAGKAGYPLVQTVSTEKGARTMTYDTASGKVYLVTSKFAAADPANPKARPAPIPGTFTILVVGR
jgi:DNA-binding beta-propeller fold protein YncE